MGMYRKPSAAFYQASYFKIAPVRCVPELVLPVLIPLPQKFIVWREAERYGTTIQ
jgi:hypothetical protein